MTSAAPSPAGVPDLGSAIRSLNEEPDLTIDDNTLGLWDGGTLDYSEAVEHLQMLDVRLAH